MNGTRIKKPGMLFHVGLSYFYLICSAMYAHAYPTLLSAK